MAVFSKAQGETRVQPGEKKETNSQVFHGQI